MTEGEKRYIEQSARGFLAMYCHQMTERQHQRALAGLIANMTALWLKAKGERA